MFTRTVLQPPPSWRRLVSHHSPTTTTLHSSSSSSSSNDHDDEKTLKKKKKKSRSWLVKRPPSLRKFRPAAADKHRQEIQITTLLRVSIPSLLAGIVATLIFPAASLQLAGSTTAVAGGAQAAGALAVLANDSGQFVQNFQTVASLLFSILVGQTYGFLYAQQESIYYALFNEVTEAKSLLEQVALVCQGRSMYPRCLESISRYVKDDLKKIQSDPAVLLSARPVDDPLEAIMYMTSVGVPSSVYETVKSLREARASRLGALQRKLPSIHMALLWILAAILVVSYPLLGAGTQTVGGYKLLTVEGILFGVMTAGIVLTLRVVGELWRPAGGAYNVDAVLNTMVSGLEEELKARLSGRQPLNRRNRNSSGDQYDDDVVDDDLAPSAAWEESTFTRRSAATRKRRPKKSDNNDNTTMDDTIQQQGADIGIAVTRIYQWIIARRQQQRQKRSP